MKSKLLFVVVILLLVTVLPACSTAPAAPLPHSMKGYEVYSWQEAGEWHFTLITGTNRNKSLEEITTDENTESADGWVDIHAVGVDGAKAMLARVPAGEWVSWNAQQFVIPNEAIETKLVFPPDDIVTEIKDYADKLGLDFFVAN
jgi:hypothetical protein